MHIESSDGATDGRGFAIMTVPGVVAVSKTNNGGQSATPPPPGVDINRLDLERLDTVNRVVEKAVGTWSLAERVRRLVLPSLLYHEIDLQHMRFLVLDDEEGEAAAVAVWEEASFEGENQSARSVQLHGLYVLPRWQRQGLGSSLLEFVSLWTGRRDIAGITARAWRESEPFFRLNGFEPLNQQSSSEDTSTVLWRSSRWMH